MKMTHTEAMKEIKKLENEKRRLYQDEKATCTVTYTANEKPIDTGYNYEETNKAIIDCDFKIRHLKAMLAKSNATTVVKGFDMTLAEALIYLGQLSQQLGRFQELSTRQPLVREGAAYRSATYEFTKALYDVNEAKKQYQECFDLISKLQMAIDLTNLTTTIDC